MGKLFVIEGGDGAGKGTQAELTLAALKERGEVTFFDFPQYESSTAGAIIGRALKGVFGDFRNLDPHLASMAYTVDRATAREKMRDALSRGHIICNRYTPSNAMYQGAKFDSPDEQDAFIKLLEKLEYEELGLPRPDLVIYLKVPYEVGQRLVKQKAVRAHLGSEQGIMDQHERDVAYMKAVIDLYGRTAEDRSDWRVIECVHDGEIRPIADINRQVLELIDAFIT